MSKTVVHVLIPYTTEMACGKQGYNNAIYREQVTCKLCKQTEHYKKLGNQPRRYRKRF